MTIPTRARLLAAATLLALPATGEAQALLDRSVRLGPQLVGYRFDDADERSITQLAFPVVVAIPFGSRLSMDVATAWAQVRYDSAAVSRTLSGLTDTQLRASYTFGADNVVLTAGFNLPTGQSTVDFATEGAAAGQIGNDFLAFPISNMGTGFAGTGGIAVARQARGWNLGAGASFRRMVEYAPFSVEGDTNEIRFQPGDEYRLRLGADRGVGRGNMALGLTFFTFGADQDGESSYSSGDRVLAQAAYAFPAGGVDWFVGAWNLLRAEGQQAGNVTAPWENVANLALAAGFRVGGQVVEPNVEVRSWMRDGERAGQLSLLGLRSRHGVGPLTVIPSVAYATGSVGTTGAETGLTGWRGLLTVAWRR